ncbi:hypothetical protein TWF281_004611 [Arthrobotrys megalospora]
MKVFATELVGSRCTKYFVSHSGERNETINHDVRNVNAGNPEDNLESGPESLFGEAAAPREFTEWGHSNENIEMDVQTSNCKKQG